jgi:hypothetical protein
MPAQKQNILRPPGSVSSEYRYIDIKIYHYPWHNGKLEYMVQFTSDI